MVGFFPTPYPDECLYSILCRYYARGGVIDGIVMASRILFGKIQSLRTSVYLPLRIERLDGWCSPSSGITKYTVTANNTLYPYWAVSYPTHRRNEIENVINSRTPTNEKIYTGFLRILRSRVKYLRYCPFCAAEDVEAYGETYWHRQHQLLEMVYCLKHEIRLVDSVVLLNDTKFRCNPASSTVNLDYDGDTLDNLAQYKNKLLKIGRECEWLITHGLNVDWSVNGYEKYWRLLRDKGVASFWGKSDYAAMDKSFYEYWGRDFIDTFFDVINIPRFNGWFHKIGKMQVSRFMPLYHILVMCWLTDSIKNFIESNPAETPFGHPPFVCENFICSHYHIDGAEMVRLVDYGSGKAAHFECVYCGLKYKYAISKQSREKRVIMDYGHLWDSELRRCCQDPKITNEQATKILKCSYSVLQLQKKKRGLLVSTALYDIEMEPMEYYKTKVMEICEQYDEVTIALLDEKVPGAYCYLQQRDYEWIRSRVVFDNERRFRIERENLLIEKLREIISTFEAEGYPDEQLSYGFVAKLMDSTRDELRFYRRRPQSNLRILLDTIIESRKNWRQEREAKIIERYSKRGSVLLKKLREIISTFEVNGYPDKQLSCVFIAKLIGSTVNELQYKTSSNLELQKFLNEIVEHRGVWRQERAAKLRECRSKREILIQNAIRQVLTSPPQERISYKYIAKKAGLTRYVLEDNPYLLKLLDGVAETKDDWYKRRLTTAYHSKPIESTPYSALEICRAAALDRATIKKYRKLFEEIVSNLNFETK